MSHFEHSLVAVSIPLSSLITDWPICLPADVFTPVWMTCRICELNALGEKAISIKVFNLLPVLKQIILQLDLQEVEYDLSRV